MGRKSNLMYPVLVTNGAVAGGLIALPMTFGLGFFQSILIAAIGVLGTSVSLRLQAKRSTNNSRSLESTVKPLEISKELEGKLEEHVEALYDLALVYEKKSSPLFPTVNGVLVNIQEFFRRIQYMSDQQSARIAAVRYADTLSKLNEALGRKYYLDIEAHPELWDDAEDRMQAVEKALNATGDQIIRNIRQLNSSNDLVYQLSLESLMQPEIDRANNQAIGIE